MFEIGVGVGIEGRGLDAWVESWCLCRPRSAEQLPFYPSYSAKSFFRLNHVQPIRHLR